MEKAYHAVGECAGWKREKGEARTRRQGELLRRCMQIVVGRVVAGQQADLLERLFKGEL